MKLAAIREEVEELGIKEGVWFSCDAEPGTYEIRLHGWAINNFDTGKFEFVYNKGQNRFELQVPFQHLINSKELHKFKRLVARSELILNRLNKLVERHKTRLDQVIAQHKLNAEGRSR